MYGSFISLKYKQVIVLFPFIDKKSVIKWILYVLDWIKFEYFTGLINVILLFRYSKIIMHNLFIKGDHNLLT